MQPSTSASASSKAIGKGLAQINARNLLGDRMLDPSFFHQRDQQRASLLPRLEPAGFKSFAISVAADRGLGSDDNDFLVLADASGGLGPRLDDANHRHMGRGRDAIKSQRGRRVAGNHQQLGAVAFEVVGRLNRIAATVSTDLEP